MAVMADSAQSRTDVQLKDGWTIRPISDPSPGKQGTLVTLPHTWNANYVKGTFYNRETMVYTRSLNVRNEMLREHRMFLRFEGVNSVADVFVNRKTAGQHKGGYTAFCMEVTDLLHEGDNELEVWVGNAFRTDVLPIAGDFNVYGGIHRPVHLLITAKDCISPTDYASSGVYVHQEKVSRTVKMNKRGLSTRQIQTAIDRMSRQGGGTVIVPDGQVNELTPEFKNIYIKDFTVDGCQRLIDVKALPERPLTNVLIENFEGHGKDFLRLQDVSGFVMKGGKIHTAAPSAVLDGCQSVMLLDMDFNGKQLKQITNNATLYVTQPCLSSKSF